MIVISYCIAPASEMYYNSAIMFLKMKKKKEVQ